MKILWLCNIILPVISEKLGEPVNPFGGWLSGLLGDLIGKENCEVTVCFPYDKCDSYIYGDVKKIDYYGYKENEDNTRTFIEILSAVQPDVIHIWGTEYKHSLDMTNAAKELGALDNVVVSIQGLVSIISKYHFYCGLPEKVWKSATLTEIKHNIRLADEYNEMANRGKYEISTLKMVKHVIGRTEWDKACVSQINSGAYYHYCNETLRDSFYQDTWSYDSCEKHSIFVSQSNYPLKGFHWMLEAMPFILKKYPDTMLYTTGTKPEMPKTFKEKRRQRTYQKYISELIEKYHLEDNVVFLGLLNESEMKKRYLKSNVFVSPSSIENSSNSIGEAMLLGTPVVSSDVGGIKSLLTHEKEGLLYQQDAPYMLAYNVCRVFDENDNITEISKNARRRARETHNKQFNVDRILEIYNIIANQ